jgi:hypothetical protein
MAKKKDKDTLAKQARGKGIDKRARIYGLRLDIVTLAVDDKPLRSIKQAIDEYRIERLGEDTE